MFVIMRGESKMETRPGRLPFSKGGGACSPYLLGVKEAGLVFLRHVLPLNDHSGSLCVTF